MLTTQLQALKAAIQADSTLLNLWAAGIQNQITAAFNVNDGTYSVWRTSVPVSEVFDAILWANLTPTDAPDGTLAWQCRSLACQGKQFNVQTMLTGRDSISGAKTNIRAGLQDALSNVPSGTAGALVSGGWGTVKTTLTRTATRAEKLFATGSGTVAAPSLLAFEGAVTDADIEAAMKS